MTSLYVQIRPGDVTILPIPYPLSPLPKIKGNKGSAIRKETSTHTHQPNL